MSLFSKVLPYLTHLFINQSIGIFEKVSFTIHDLKIKKCNGVITIVRKKKFLDGDDSPLELIFRHETKKPPYKEILNLFKDLSQAMKEENIKEITGKGVLIISKILNILIGAKKLTLPESEKEIRFFIENNPLKLFLNKKQKKYYLKHLLEKLKKIEKEKEKEKKKLKNDKKSNIIKENIISFILKPEME